MTLYVASKLISIEKRKDNVNSVIYYKCVKYMEIVTADLMSWKLTVQTNGIA